MTQRITGAISRLHSSVFPEGDLSEMAWFRKLWEGRRSGSSHRREIVGANSLLRGDLEHGSAASLTRLPSAAVESRTEHRAPFPESQLKWIVAIRRTCEGADYLE
jgi:hypothetical protein